VVSSQERLLNLSPIEHRHKASAGPRPLWFSIDSVEGEAQAGDAIFASSIGTNLAALSPAAMAVLQRHGGSLMQARIKKYAPELTV